MTAPRLPPEIETTAYFIVAEASRTSSNTRVPPVRSSRSAPTAATLSIEVRDDGCGGADPAQGTGLTGLLDRVEAHDGTLTLTSPPATGTTLHVMLPAGGLDAEHRRSW